MKPILATAEGPGRRFHVAPKQLRGLTASVVLTVGASTLGFSAAAWASGTSAAGVSSPGRCAPDVVHGVIPSWARGGFSDPKPTMHYELSKDRDIAALLFAYPLLAPPPTTHNNKILWVSHVPINGSPLWITARRMIGSQVVGQVIERQVIGGPGPSIINLPVAGCWRLNLRWSGHRDVLDVRYVVH